MRSLRCFIASAFGKKDVDIIFTKVIRPVLRTRRITPDRIDRVEHNDDIDDKILELIESCDFCIADLTYARPSVYYEAGRVLGKGKPVIFLARSDHFNPKEDDQFDNFRIHFDLQMKNIIKWTEPTTSLRNRLSSRLNVVTKPLLEVLRENESQKQAEISFGKLPQQEKLLTIVQLTESALQKMKFRLEEKRWIKTDVLGVRKAREESIMVWCLAQASFTKSRLEDIRNSIPFAGSVSDFLEKMKVDIKKKITSHIFCCSLRPTPESRITDALPHFSPHEQLKVYSYVRKGKRIAGESIMHIHFLDGIDSVPAIQDQLKKHLPLVGKLNDRTVNNLRQVTA
jgi:hypothetical protein